VSFKCRWCADGFRSEGCAVSPEIGTKHFKHYFDGGGGNIARNILFCCSFVVIGSKGDEVNAFLFLSICHHRGQ